MITIVPNEKLGFLFALGQSHNEVVDSLRGLFVKHYGQEIYSKSKVIIVSEEKFFHVIKNAYHLPATHELEEELQEYLLRYINL